MRQQKKNKKREKLGKKENKKKTKIISYLSGRVCVPAWNED